MVKDVDAPETHNGFYRVYLSRPGNLLQMQEVQATLEQQSGVLMVTSLAGWLLPENGG